MFRNLKKDEIDVRVAYVKENGFSVLLYKDARADMIILDESVGAMNWKREHTRDNKNCIVSIWDSKKNMWISKEDTGTESNNEREKGLASDSFKRACFNWGIGRELYTAPFIWISDVNLAKKKIKVADIEISDKRIISLMLECEGKCIFSWTSEEYRKIKGIEEIKKKCDDMKKITNLLKEYNKNTLEECELDEIKKIYKKIS